MPLDQHGNLSPDPEHAAGAGDRLGDASLSPAPNSADSVAAPADPTPAPTPDLTPDPDPDAPLVPGPFFCSRCGTAVPITAELAETIEALPDLARRLDVALLCPACSGAGLDLLSPDVSPDATQPPSSQRIFRAEVRIRELVPGPPPEVVHGVIVTREAWEDVAGFAIEGPGRSVRDFTDSHAEEWALRMEQVLKFADL